jgi:hypothetical protein
MWNMMRLTKSAVAVLVLSLVLAGSFAGCDRQKSKHARKPSSELTERQRDSTIAASRLPGANAVGRAMAVSDSAEARAKQLNDGQ